MKILNRHYDGPKDGQYFIGRGSPWGNPFVIGPDGTREEVIAKYEPYARERLRKEPHWLRPLLEADALVCFCKPKPCHGDVIVKLLGELYG